MICGGCGRSCIKGKSSVSNGGGGGRWGVVEPSLALQPGEKCVCVAWLQG